MHRQSPPPPPNHCSHLFFRLLSCARSVWAWNTYGTCGTKIRFIKIFDVRSLCTQNCVTDIPIAIQSALLILRSLLVGCFCFAPCWQCSDDRQWYLFAVSQPPPFAPPPLVFKRTRCSVLCEVRFQRAMTNNYLTRSSALIQSSV